MGNFKNKIENIILGGAIDIELVVKCRTNYKFVYEMYRREVSIEKNLFNSCSGGCNDFPFDEACVVKVGLPYLKCPWCRHLKFNQIQDNFISDCIKVAENILNCVLMEIKDNGEFRSFSEFRVLSKNIIDEVWVDVVDIPKNSYLLGVPVRSYDTEVRYVPYESLSKTYLNFWSTGNVLRIDNKGIVEKPQHFFAEDDFEKVIEDMLEEELKRFNKKQMEEMEEGNIFSGFNLEGESTFDIVKEHLK